MYKYNMENIEYGMWYVIATAGTNDKGCFITGEARTGKTTTANKLKSQLQPHQYKICTLLIKVHYYMMMHKQYVHYLILINIIIPI
jgi:hypothetical protein